MNLFSIGLVIDTIGKVLIGIAVLRVHRHIFKERKIDADVLEAMRREWLQSFTGIMLIIAGAILQLFFYQSS